MEQNVGLREIIFLDSAMSPFNLKNSLYFGWFVDAIEVYGGWAQQTWIERYHDGYVGHVHITQLQRQPPKTQFVFWQTFCVS